MNTVQQSRAAHPWEGSAPSVWTLDAAQSTFAFRVKHFWGLMTVQGHFTQVAGEATIDADGAVAVRLEIDAASLDTKHRQRDKHLRSKDFFHVAQHPAVTFTSRRIVAKGGDRFAVEGDLRAAGHSQAITFEARVRGTSGDAITVDAEVTVDRTAFGMTWSPLGMAARTATLVIHAHFGGS